MARFTGQLLHDSPACAQALRRLALPASSLAQLSDLYRLSVERGGAEEDPVERGAEESFNPRPARLCQIILTSSDERDPTVLGAALLSPASITPYDREDLSETLELARAAQSFPSSVGSARRIATERIALALRLDEIRHLHRTSLDSAARAQRITRCKMVADAAHHPENSRLRTLLTTAIRSFSELARL